MANLGRDYLLTANRIYDVANKVWQVAWMPWEGRNYPPLQPTTVSNRSIQSTSRFLYPTTKGDAMTRTALTCALLAAVLCTGVSDTSASDPMNIPAIKSFLGGGFGAKHEKAPQELDQFGRLVGLWHVAAEMRRQDGTWAESAPGVWAWKYAIDGFAVRDLWYQGADNLPVYMANLGRDYLLTANRIYDVANKVWQVAWMRSWVRTSGHSPQRSRMGRSS
jgi:hypothetical protein